MVMAFYAEFAMTRVWIKRWRCSGGRTHFATWLHATGKVEEMDDLVRFYMMRPNWPHHLRHYVLVPGCCPPPFLSHAANICFSFSKQTFCRGDKHVPKLPRRCWAQEVNLRQIKSYCPHPSIASTPSTALHNASHIKPSVRGTLHKIIDRDPSRDPNGDSHSNGQVT